MKTKISTRPVLSPASIPAHHFGLKAFFWEPLLILGSALLWLAVLPFAGLFFSGAVLVKRAANLL